MTKYSGEDVLDLMSAFAKNRNAAIEKMIVHGLHLDVGEKKVVEFGAGKGEFLKRIVRRKNVSVLGVEQDISFRKFLSDQFTVYSSLQEVNEKVDGIYLIDVLEHLQDDQSYLNDFFAKLKPGGRLFIYVPARRELFSDFDKKIGHYRRYDREELIQKVKAAGFEIESVHYHDFVGYLAMIVQKWITGHTFPKPWSAKLYDRFLFPFGHFFEKRVKPPVGKSIFLTGIAKISQIKS